MTCTCSDLILAAPGEHSCDEELVRCICCIWKLIMFYGWLMDGAESTDNFDRGLRLKGPPYEKNDNWTKFLHKCPFGNSNVPVQDPARLGPKWGHMKPCPGPNDPYMHSNLGLDYIGPTWLWAPWDPAWAPMWAQDSRPYLLKKLNIYFWKRLLKQVPQ